MLTSLPHTYSCFVCGQDNPSGLNLRFQTDGQLVTAQFVPEQKHVGFKGAVHGGVISSVLDEVMVWASAIHSRKFAYCAELNVRFLRPIAPGARITASGTLVENRRNKIFLTKGELRDELGNLMAAATGKYLPVKEELASEFAADFVDDASHLFPPTLPKPGNADIY